MRHFHFLSYFRNTPNEWNENRNFLLCLFCFTHLIVSVFFSDFVFCFVFFIISNHQNDSCDVRRGRKISQLKEKQPRWGKATRKKGKWAGQKKKKRFWQSERCKAKENKEMWWWWDILCSHSKDRQESSYMICLRIHTRCTRVTKHTRPRPDVFSSFILLSLLNVSVIAVGPVNSRAIKVTRGFQHLTVWYMEDVGGDGKGKSQRIGVSVCSCVYQKLKKKESAQVMMLFSHSTILVWWQPTCSWVSYKFTQHNI